MRDLMHDEIDAVEDIQERWHAKLNAIKANIAEVAKDAASFQDLLDALLVQSADALAELTTEAANVGVDFGRRKAKRALDDKG